MSVVYQKAFDHIDANSRPMQFLDRHLLHQQPAGDAADQTPREHQDDHNRTARSSPLALHAQAIHPPKSQSIATDNTLLQPPTHTLPQQPTHGLVPAHQSLAPLHQSMPSISNPPFRGGLAQYAASGSATQSPLQRLGAQQGTQGMASITMPAPTSLLPVSSSADSTPNSVMAPAAVVPTGHGVSTWIQQQPSSSVPIVTQSVVNPPMPTMTAHHVSATPSAKIVIPMQATATAFTTQETTTEGQVLKTAATGEEARSGSTGAPQILKKHKRKHAKKVKARPSSCGCC